MKKLYNVTTPGLLTVVLAESKKQAKSFVEGVEHIKCEQVIEMGDAPNDYEHLPSGVIESHHLPD